MNKTNYLLIFLIGFSVACNKQQLPMEELRQQVMDTWSEEDGDLAVAFLDLQSGDTLLINAGDEFHAASTMKTPVMIEVYKQAKEKKFALSDSILVKDVFKSIVDTSTFQLPSSSDSEKDLYAKVGKKRTIAALTYDMIIRSSNLATNIIIELVGPESVTRTMRELGASDIQVLRGVEDLKAFERGMSNTTTAFDLMVIYSKLAKGEVVSESASSEMIDILFDQAFNDVIPAELPGNVTVAHKTGTITGVHHDSGVVYLPDGRKYVLVLLSRNLKDFEEGTKKLARISKIIYDHEMKE